jgi:hypothetical protein
MNLEIESLSKRKRLLISHCSTKVPLEKFGHAALSVISSTSKLQNLHFNILGIIRYRIEFYESLQRDWIEEANAPDNLGPILPREKKNKDVIDEAILKLEENDDNEKYDGLEELKNRIYTPTQHSY